MCRIMAGLLNRLDISSWVLCKKDFSQVEIQYRIDIDRAFKGHHIGTAVLCVVAGAANHKHITAHRIDRAVADIGLRPYVLSWNMRLWHAEIHNPVVNNFFYPGWVVIFNTSH